jgi:hypothetical protein
MMRSEFRDSGSGVGDLGRNLKLESLVKARPPAALEVNFMRR